MLKALMSVFVGFIFIFFIVQVSEAITLINPEPNSVFHPGDIITLKAVPSTGENPTMVIFSIKGGTCKPVGSSFIRTSPPYEIQCEIPREKTPGTMTVEAAGMLPGDNVVEASVSFQVAFPSELTLTGLRLPSSQETLVFIKLGSIEHIRVKGLFSDNVERRVDSPAAGTVFESSDPTIATVTPTGDVEAKKNGKAVITIKNGNYQVQVPVVVKAE